MSKEYEAPQWNDPAVKYFKKSINDNANIIRRITNNEKLKIGGDRAINKNFLYPLWNSPKRRQCYKEIAKDYKDNLLRQINSVKFILWLLQKIKQK